jgi:hypothetical protein
MLIITERDTQEAIDVAWTAPNADFARLNVVLLAKVDACITTGSGSDEPSLRT